VHSEAHDSDEHLSNLRLNHDSMTAQFLTHQRRAEKRGSAKPLADCRRVASARCERLGGQGLKFRRNLLPAVGVDGS
jgi:hypothetical protein